MDGLLSLALKTFALILNTLPRISNYADENEAL